MKYSENRKDYILTSPWIVIGGAVILLVIVLIFSADSALMEKDHMNRALTEKGESLITAFEAGARTGMMRMNWGIAHLQRLIEETGKGPDIRYIVIADSSGRIISHSNPSMIGSAFDTEILKKVSESEKKPLYRISKDDKGAKTFELFDIFRPMSSKMHQMRMGKGGRGGGGHMTDQKSGQTPEHMSERCDESVCVWGQGDNLVTYSPPLYISVGLDMTHFESAGRTRTKNALMMAGVILVLGLSGFVSIYWLQSYRSARQRLEDTSAFADKVVSSLPVGIIATDFQGRIAVFNESMERLSGISLSSAFGKGLDEVISSETLGLILRIHEAKSADDSTNEIESKVVFNNGESFHSGIITAGIGKDSGEKRNGLIIIMRDLTVIRELETRLIRHEKLAAIGSLAAGVAHEIRNPLSSIKGLATYFRDLFSEGSDSRDTAIVIIKEVDRINRVIKDLLEFSKPSEISPSMVIISELVDHVLRLISADIQVRGITSSADIQKGLKARIDRDRFSQVLINLCRNSIEAMEGGGSLSIFAEKVQGNTLRLIVSDTGRGIDPKFSSSIFNPYFTTKKDGTGLGLAVAQKIVEAHGGCIQLMNNGGKGARLCIEIPDAVI